MAKYIIKVESTNPEFPLDERYIKGMECDGFIIGTYDSDENPDTLCVHDANVMMMARTIKGNTDLRMAAALAEGMEKAAQIGKENVKNKIGSLAGLANLFGGHGLGGYEDE